MKNQKIKINALFYNCLTVFFIIMIFPVYKAGSEMNFHLPNSTILWVEKDILPVKKGPGEGRIITKGIMYACEKTGWEPRMLINIEHSISLPKLSPDGKNVIWYHGDITYEANLINNKITKLFSGVSSSYSPSGKYIAYTSKFSLENGEKVNAIYIFNRKNSHINVIQKDKLKYDIFGSMNWVNDKVLAFQVKTTSTKSCLLRVFDLNNNTYSDTNCPNLTHASNFALSPDHTKWVFSASNRDEHYFTRIYTMSIDGKNLKKIYEDGSEAYHVSPSWSPEGNFIVFVAANEGIGAITIVELDTGKSYRFPKSRGLMPSWGMPICCDFN